MDKINSCGIQIVKLFSFYSYILISTTGIHGKSMFSSSCCELVSLLCVIDGYLIVHNIHYVKMLIHDMSIMVGIS